MRASTSDIGSRIGFVLAKIVGFVLHPRPGEAGRSNHVLKQIHSLHPLETKPIHARNAANTAAPITGNKKAPRAASAAGAMRLHHFANNQFAADSQENNVAPN